MLVCVIPITHNIPPLFGTTTYYAGVPNMGGWGGGGRNPPEFWMEGG